MLWAPIPTTPDHWIYWLLGVVVQKHLDVTTLATPALILRRKGCEVPTQPEARRPDPLILGNRLWLFNGRGRHSEHDQRLWSSHIQGFLKWSPVQFPYKWSLTRYWMIENSSHTYSWTWLTNWALWTSRAWWTLEKKRCMLSAMIKGIASCQLQTTCNWLCSPPHCVSFSLKQTGWTDVITR